ncbi:hypothetical protein D3C71_1034690 [compost metagenome]
MKKVIKNRLNGRINMVARSVKMIQRCMDVTGIMILQQVINMAYVRMIHMTIWFVSGLLRNNIIYRYRVNQVKLLIM